MLRDRYKDNLVDEIETAMTFASITSVDDDVESKQAVQKIGNKTVFGGIDAKINQLHDQGISDIALDHYTTLWHPLNEATKNQ